MEDPTISEGTFNTLVEEILKAIKEGIGEEGIGEGQIKEELQAASFEGRLKSANNSAFFIMTINMNVKTSAGAGTQEKRRKLLNVILSRIPSSIIFCQELPGKFEEEVIPEGCHSVENEKEAAVLWNTQAFDASTCGLEPNNPQMIKIRDDITKEKEEASELLSRIAMVKLTPKRVNTDAKTKTILAVSCHGPYRAKKQEKELFFDGLLKFLLKVKETRKDRDIDSFIIGGDFNIDTLDVGIPKNVVVPSYESSPRQTQASKAIPHKDNFVYYPRENLTVSWTRPILLEDNKTAYSDINAEDHDSTQKQLKDTTATHPRSSGSKPAKITDMLDHDPVVAVLEFPLQSKAVQNLSEEFDKVSVSKEAAAESPEK